jgi:hypothetical protein
MLLPNHDLKLGLHELRLEDEGTLLFVAYFGYISEQKFENVLHILLEP